MGLEGIILPLSLIGWGDTEQQLKINGQVGFLTEGAN